MKNLLVKFLGPLLAVAGVLGLTGSSILWNFQGRSLGLPATVLSLLILAAGVVLLRPLQPAATAGSTELMEATGAKGSTTALTKQAPANQEFQNSGPVELEQKASEASSEDSPNSKKTLLTTAEAIAAQLAAAEANKPELVLVNFAPEALSPGNSIRFNKRVPGRNLSGFRDMASDLFKTN